MPPVVYAHVARQLPLPAWERAVDAHELSISSAWLTCEPYVAVEIELVGSGRSSAGQGHLKMLMAGL